MTQARIFLLVIGLILAAAILILLPEQSTSSCPITETERVAQGNSLTGILESGESVKILFGYYACHEPERGDLVLFNSSGGSEPLIKIIQGVPGDQWQLSPTSGGYNDLIINGQILKTPSGGSYQFDEQR